MKKPSEIYGFVVLENEQYPFFFDTKSFELEVFPPTITKWEDLRFDAFKLLGEKSKKHRWLEYYQVEGITSSNRQICFSIREKPIINNGFRKYHVQWVLYDYTGDSENIIGIRITGGDINYFYPAENNLKSDFEYRDNHTIKKIIIESKEIINNPCGKFRCSKGVDANIEVFASSTFQFNNAEQPIYAKSSLNVDYSRALSIETVIKNIQDIRSFFIYAFYRSNIHFEEIVIYEKNNSDEKCKGGQILLPENIQIEKNEKKKERVIKYDFWHTNMARMLSVIKNKKIGFEHICSEINTTHSYPISRFIMILTEFEKEYRNIYGNDSIRSIEYKLLKKEVVGLLNNLKEEKTGKDKNRLKSIIKGVNNTDDIYSERVKKALNDCKLIMNYFIKDKYNGSYKKNAEKIANRIGDIRNGIAHGKLNFKINAINVDDINIIERLMYAIRLKKYEKNDLRIAYVIAELFGDDKIKNRIDFSK